MFKGFLVFCFCGLLAVGYILFVVQQGPQPRDWRLQDGRTSKLVASHIDGQSIYFANEEGGDLRPVSLELLHNTDRAYALQHCTFKPASADAEQSGENAQSAIRIWEHWQKTFTKHPQGGTAVLTRLASDFRQQIVAAVDDAARLEQIQVDLGVARQKILARSKSQQSVEKPTSPDATSSSASLRVGTVDYFLAKQRESNQNHRPADQSATMYGGPPVKPAPTQADKLNAVLQDMRTGGQASGPPNGRRTGRVSYSKSSHGMMNGRPSSQQKFKNSSNPSGFRNSKAQAEDGRNP